MKSKTLWASLLFLAAFAVCLLGLNPTFYMDDSPETIAVSSVLGIDHPPGYPLYTLWGRLFSLLPLSQPAFRVNLLSAFWASVVCVLLFFLLQKCLHLRPLLGLSVSLLWLAGATAYPAALSAKMGIYQMTAFFLLAVLFSLLKGRWRLASFLFGLSLANHWMSMAVYAPGFLFLLAGTNRDRRRPLGRSLAEAAGLMLLGVSPYLFLPLRGSLHPVIDWGDPVGFTAFFNHITRRAYSDLGAGFSPRESLEIAGWYLKSCLLEFPGFFLFALAGAVLLHRRTRRLSTAFLLLWALPPAAFALFSRVPMGKSYLFSDYSISTRVILLLWVGVALEWMAERLALRGRGLRTYLGTAAALCLGLLGYRFFTARQTFYTYTYDYAMNAFQSVPEDGLLFCKGDVLDFPCWYLQILEGVRQDLAVLGAGSLPMDWYRIRLARAHPGLQVPYPSHMPGKEYIRGRLFVWMLEHNPDRSLAFTYPDPSQDGFVGLTLQPYGLTLRGFRAGSPSPWDEARSERAWDLMRLRHYSRSGDSLDKRSWDYFLKDYAMARAWMGAEEVRQASTLAAPGRGKGGRRKADALYQKALSHFRWAADWDKGNPVYSLNLAQIYGDLGDDGRAMGWIQQSLREDPKSPQAWFLAGILAYKSGDPAQAEMSMEKALELDPGYGRARQALQYLQGHPAPPSASGVR